jgi:RNA polymerase sigma-70 factor (ECF subfamily)
MTYTTHTTLLSRLSDGVDPTAWKEFHDRYNDLLRGFAYRYGLQQADCDDIVQEVLLALSKSMPGFEYDPGRGKFRSYLKTLTIRTVFQILRQKRTQKTLEDVDSAIEHAMADPDTESMWEEEWRQFNEKDRMAFSLYAVKNRPAQETADTLGLSTDQVYQAKSRILRRLGEMIEEQIRDEG